MEAISSDKILEMGLALQIVADCCRNVTMAGIFSYMRTNLPPNSTALDAANLLGAPLITVADIISPFSHPYNISTAFEDLISGSKEADIRYNYIPGINMTLFLAILSTLVRLTARITTLEALPLTHKKIVESKKKFKLRRWCSMLQASDWWIVVAVLTSMAFCTAGLFGLKYFRIGTHIWSATYYEYLGYTKLRYWGELWYLPALGCVKCSLLAFYLSLTPNVIFRRICWGLAIFTVLLTTQMDIMLAFACKPILFWHDLLNYKCIHHDAAKAAYYIQNISNILTDFAILILPIPLVWRLQLGLRDKLLAIGLFSLGSFACAASIVRSMTLARFAENSDPTWAAGFTLVWSALELNIGILCANIPISRTFLARILSRCIHHLTARAKAVSMRDFIPRKLNASSMVGRNRSDTVESASSFETFSSDAEAARAHHGHHLDEIKEEDEGKAEFIGIALAPCHSTSTVQVERVV